MRREVLLGMAIALAVAATAAAGVGVGVGVHVRVAPRVWIGADWHWVPAWVAVSPNPNLAVVDTNIHPKHTRLYLDGRFIGLADDFDGYPDFLYLEPGSYRLECRLGGYRTELVEIEAEAGYRYDIRFRMKRIKGEKKEHWWERPERPKPVQRLYGPKPVGGSREEVARPDPSLRPDLGSGPPAAGSGAATAREMGSLALRVTPPSAAVYLDGEFLATGRELGQLENPVALKAGTHRIDVVAPGYRSETREIHVAPGEVVRLAVTLVRGSGQGPSPDL